MVGNLLRKSKKEVSINKQVQKQLGYQHFYSNKFEAVKRVLEDAMFLSLFFPFSVYF